MDTSFSRESQEVWRDAAPEWPFQRVRPRPIGYDDNYWHSFIWRYVLTTPKSRIYEKEEIDYRDQHSLDA